jgi:hypothetical protein
MLRQLLVGGAVSVCNIAIHGSVMALVVHIATRMAPARHTVEQSVRLAVVIIAAASIATVPVLMIAHFSEVMYSHWPTRSSVPNPPVPTQYILLS